MEINLAVKKALKESHYIYRESERSLGIRILPTNTSDCCLIISNDSDNVGKRWNPTAEDLVAKDWKVTPSVEL